MSEIPEKVEIDDGYIVLCDYYDIRLDKCATAEDILMWVIHLAPKTWVTKSMLKLFVVIACTEHGIAMYVEDVR